MRDVIFGISLGMIIMVLTIMSAEQHEISKCEQGGLHCEMRAIPVMEMKE